MASRNTSATGLEAFDRTPRKTHTWLRSWRPWAPRTATGPTWPSGPCSTKERHKEGFLAQAARGPKTPSGPAVDPEAARAVFGVLAKKVSEGELRDILGLLPKELKELWPRA